MKRILFFFLTFSLTASAFSQDVDSTKIKVPITLKAKYLFFIKDFMQSNDQPERLIYYHQVASAMDTAFNPEQAITVTVESKLIVDLYVMMGLQQERYTTVMNAEIKDALLPQVYSYPWILGQLQAINASVQDEINRRILSGYQFFKSIK